MHKQDFLQLPDSVKYLIFHGLLNPRDTYEVMQAIQDANHFQLQPGDLWRIETDRGMAS